MSRETLNVTKSRLNSLLRHVASESRLSALPDEESQGTLCAHPDSNASYSATISVMKAAHHVNVVIYVVKSVVATVTNRLLSFEMRTTRHQVYMLAAELLQTT